MSAWKQFITSNVADSKWLPWIWMFSGLVWCVIGPSVKGLPSMNSTATGSSLCWVVMVWESTSDLLMNTPDAPESILAMILKLCFSGTWTDSSEPGGFPHRSRNKDSEKEQAIQERSHLGLMRTERQKQIRSSQGPSLSGLDTKYY
ncbi:hypothetical protein AX774_g8076 [Zancudomyces culisetae]|uniref:Uncharacterized protein n=1 Tax=Zancudomyces culisetae TaxID=1213189 RepID=A0A1R1PCF5_ZANCU|nr:hypothetical protein AX774_g8076 [Zancudomyces culisetae]|eukprot:OMH78532.1 hypothetical protein AX774_g8076 [Zancudomyces culisetae]